MANSSETSTKKLDLQKIQNLQGRVVTDLAATAGVACAYIGDRLGLYKAMSGAGPLTSVELAQKTSTHERYVREWLVNQAASGYIDYDPATYKFNLTDEHAAVLAAEDGQFFAAGGFQTFVALVNASARITDCFRNGTGMSWGDHQHDLFEGTERFFRPSYVGQLVSQWIPSINGLKERLEKGAVVADVGCGHGATTFIMAEAFPNSRFYGFDNHGPSIERASADAKAKGLAGRVSFEVSSADAIPDQQFDLIAFFDCLHDMGDPIGACKRARTILQAEGRVMIVEPMAGNHVEDNFNPIGRTFSGASVLCCTPNAIAGGGSALGTIATDAALADVLHAGGFKNFRRATETPFNRVFEAS